jgi:hypothetical protein
MQKQDDKSPQGSRQQGQQNDNRPQRDRDLQRNKQGDRGHASQGGGRDQQSGGPQQQNSQNVYGEGNYAASRQYNEATHEFVKSGRVEQAARDAAPQSDADALQMQAAEEEGKRHAKGEDPALSRKRASLPPDQPTAPKPGKE